MHLFFAASAVSRPPRLSAMAMLWWIFSAVPSANAFSTLGSATTTTVASASAFSSKTTYLAMENGNSNSGNNLVAVSDANILDRFRSVCLVGNEGKEAVERFDQDLYSSLEHDENDLWVAVYRSNNNKPSVVVRDDFFRAMNDATTTNSKNNNDDSNNNDDAAAASPVSTVSGAAAFLSDTVPGLLEIKGTNPVAISRLAKSDTSTSTQTVYLLDNLRCSLKKEDQDPSCDGGSEYLEALGVAVDTLLLGHLRNLLKDHGSTGDENETNSAVVFEGTVRTKATLFSGKLFEQRGFAEVTSLSRDMATHLSSYDACFERYADRSIGATIAAGTRDRALQIVALLGRLDPEQQTQTTTNNENDEGSGDVDDEYDPWANVQWYRS